MNNMQKRSGKWSFDIDNFLLFSLALKYRLFLTILFFILVNIYIVSSSTPTFATASTLNVTVTNSISLDISPLSKNGTFASSSTSDNINISTDNYTGYTLGIKARTSGSNALINTADSTKTLPSIATNVPEANYQSDVYKDTYNNTWGYKPSKYYDTTNNTTVVNTNSLYFPAPTSTTDQTILAKTTTANTMNSQTNELNSDGYNIAIGSRINLNATNGTYENVFVITAVANLIPYSITYNANAGTDSSLANMPVINPDTGNVGSDTINPTVTIASAPTRDGYEFLGWCTAQVSANATCTGAEYAAGSTYTIDYTNSNTFTLYARWKQLLYGLVSEQVKTYNNNGNPRTQTSAELQATITAPTSNNPATDTSNSGVYLYNAGVFGTASDASNDYPIYYYRGILDSSFASTDSNGNIGSSGNSGYYQNYVILDANGTKETTDTCWRIIRTTGSGGVKMIYNGLYGATTANSCANGLDNAQAASYIFSGTSSTSNQIVRVGYTYNNSYAKNTHSEILLSNLFGSNTNYSGNNTDSDIKNYLENTWFSSTISSYESILESGAGYCNDRTLYNNQYVLQDETTASIDQYSSSSDLYPFGARTRNMSTSQLPSLNCPRDTVDLYTTSAASNGNKQLGEPVALLTTDEASFAGSGNATASNGSTYNVNSFLRSGNTYWFLSPNYRSIYGTTLNFLLSSGNGVIDIGRLYQQNGVRPVISLRHSTSATSGSGTAADPWVVSNL